MSPNEYMLLHDCCAVCHWPAQRQGRWMELHHIVGGSGRKDLEINTTAIRDTADEQAKAEAKPSELAQKTPPPEKPKIPTVQQVKATTATQTAGTFSGFAAGMMGGTTSALDRMADQSAKANELLSKIAENTSEDQTLAFGS